MDDLHEHLGSSPRSPRPQQGLNRRWPNVLLSDGYDSDSTLIRKTGRIPEVDPDQQKAWYKEIQKGGEIPLTGLRKSAPERPAGHHRYRHLSSNSTLPLSRVKSGSVQDLIHKFEPDFKKENVHSKLSMKHGSQRTVNRYDSILFGSNGEKESCQPYFCQSTTHFRITATQTISPEIFSDRCKLEKRYNQKSQENQNFWKSAVQQSINKRIQNLISRFENSETYQSQQRKISGGSHSNFYSNYASNTNSVPNLYINSSKNFNFPASVGTISRIGRTLPSQSVVSSAFKGNRYHLPNCNRTAVSSPTAYLQKYSPRVQNSSPRPYVKRTASIKNEMDIRTGDIVYITKQVDKNWYEGEHHGLVGIFPVTYVEGEKVVLIRRLDHNWFEGRLGAKKGIFPISYVEVLQEPGEFSGTRTASPKPPASPVLLYDAFLFIARYRALYAYKPQNDDELELKEGDTVYVMEKCDDGWYVGTSLRTGLFGTFPGNYVERI
ncbi:Sorbin and SH3 domain-containing protein 2 [Argiope bruennichi]|uniref:Sorbin and SH3 domain-containing protein 2 n=1 Tax=Argiope bruennichi TaxID=94029 RepID=A0A8T0EE54_ARGBR|nr:Sorbin and SH3 domain-containing protein 2 [Argiope bruennichi]